MTAETFKFDLQWRSFDASCEYVTSADLTILYEGEPLWPVFGEAVSLDIQADDLLSHLCEFWKPILLRQTLPIPLASDRPSMLRVDAERRWATLHGKLLEMEDGLVTAFEDAHDLARSFAGQFDLPSLWLLRSGDEMVVETQQRILKLPFADVEASLVKVGNLVAERLETAGHRWARLVGAWRSRDVGDPTTLLAWSTSLRKTVAGKLLTDGVLDAPLTVAAAANDDDELRIAARMANALPESEMRRILALIRGFAKSATPRLDALAEATHAHLRAYKNHRPYEQGEAAASFVRDFLQLAEVQFFDVDATIRSLGVDIRAETVELGTLDGLAVWGRRHGPSVFINVGSKRLNDGRDLSRNVAARVTLAHELCHLLVDQGHAVSAVDVLNSHMTIDVEQRAKAFAGELLLPSRIAADFWEAQSPFENVIAVFSAS